MHRHDHEYQKQGQAQQDGAESLAFLELFAHAAVVEAVTVGEREVGQGCIHGVQCLAQGKIGAKAGADLDDAPLVVALDAIGRGDDGQFRHVAQAYRLAVPVAHQQLPGLLQAVEGVARQAQADGIAAIAFQIVGDRAAFQPHLQGATDVLGANAERGGPLPIDVDHQFLAQLLVVVCNVAQARDPAQALHGLVAQFPQGVEIVALDAHADVVVTAPEMHAPHAAHPHAHPIAHQPQLGDALLHPAYPLLTG